MTREEAIKELQAVAEEQFVADRAEALYMAIEALKQQSAICTAINILKDLL